MRRSANLQRLIVEFSHPGTEFRPGGKPKKDRAICDDETCTSGLRCWNSESSHKRKFLISRGWMRDAADGKDISALLTFWGEWEPQSRFKKLSSITQKATKEAARLPAYVHEPLLLASSVGTNNTDPFVFGRDFWFTNCKQKKNPFLTLLAIGSLILFGSEYDRGFALDTIFVVGKRFSPMQYLKRRTICPEQLRLATLDHNDLARKSPSDIFYRGKIPSDGKPFSFIPCKRADSPDAVQGHDRVLLCYEKFGLQKPGARTVCTTLMNSERLSDGSVTEEIVISFWDKIVRECHDQGFFLGHSIQLPPIIKDSSKIESDRNLSSASCL